MPPFNIRRFVAQVAVLVQRDPRPRSAARIYAAAAHKVRLEAGRPENARARLSLSLIASKFDEYAAEALIPEIEPDSGEEVHNFADGSRIPTEYEGLVEDIAESKIGPNGEPLDEAESLAVLAQLQKARANEVAPLVNIFPATARPERLGDSALVQYGGTSGSGSFVATQGGISGPVKAVQEARVISWDGDDLGQSVACTVALFVNARGANATYPAGGFNYRPFARIQWGGGQGRPNEVLVDVCQGRQVTLAANSLYVDVGMDAPPSDQTPGSMLISATLGFFSAAKSAPNYRTAYADNIANGSTSTIAIPAFATAVAALLGTAIPQWTFAVQDASGNTLFMLDLTGSFQSRGWTTPLPSNAYQIVATNNTGGEADAQIVFELAV